MIKAYYQLTKPGIIYGNAITAMAGFFLASRGVFHPGLFFAMLMGLSLIIGSACAFNNVADAAIDAKMERTQKRAIVTGEISKTSAMILASILGIIGTAALLLFTNLYALLTALLGMFFYLALYTPLKRKTIYGTLIGAVAGATPPVVGYLSVTGKLDLAAWLLFLILIFWQMPHFYAIAIRRLEEYTAAGIPALPVKLGVEAAKIQMQIYIAAFTLAAAGLTYFKYTGYTYLAAIGLLGLYWFVSGLRGFGALDDKLWAKKMFLLSLIIITLFSVAVSFVSFLR